MFSVLTISEDQTSEFEDVEVSQTDHPNGGTSIILVFEYSNDIIVRMKDGVPYLEYQDADGNDHSVQLRED